MKNIIKLQKSVLTILAVLITTVSVAQDVRFSQAIYNPLTINPAMMGLNPDLRAMLQYRNQWAGADKGFSTYSFAGFAPLYINEGKDKLDFGFGVINDVAGAYSNLDVSIAAGYNARLSKSSYLNMSLQGGYKQNMLKMEDLTFDEQYVLGEYNASNPSNETNLNKKASMADFSFGLMWYTAPIKINLGKVRNISMFTGASVFHLNTPSVTNFDGGGENLSRRFSVQGGVKIEGSKNIDFTPNYYITSQDGNNNFAAGLLVDYRFDDYSILTLGSYYRHEDAFSVIVGFEYDMLVKLSYSYDIMDVSPVSNSVSKLHTHEVTLAVKFTQIMKPGGAKIIPAFF